MSTQDVQDLSNEPQAWGSSEEAEGYAVKLPVFEGPLDLLLHLIRQNEVEISEIPIAQICAQYLDYLNIMRELNLDVAAEYLVMAATLALIKSRMLLPSEEQEDEGLDGDPRALLIARLLEYERYKEVAEALARRRLLGRDVFIAHGPGPERVGDAEREIEVGLFELIEAFRLVLRNAPSGESHSIETETVSVRERMVLVMQRLEIVGSLEFNQIFEVEGESLPSRPVIIATFLGILELTRLAAITIYQGQGELGSPEGPIRIRSTEQRPGGEVSETDWRDRISDLM